MKVTYTKALEAGGKLAAAVYNFTHPVKHSKSLPAVIDGMSLNAVIQALYEYERAWKDYHRKGRLVRFYWKVVTTYPVGHPVYPDGYVSEDVSFHREMAQNLVRLQVKGLGMKRSNVKMYKMFVYGKPKKRKEKKP